MWKEYFRGNYEYICACFPCLFKWLTGNIVRRAVSSCLKNPKYFNGNFYKLGEWLYHLCESHFNWFTCNREPDSFTFAFWGWNFWSKHGPWGRRHLQRLPRQRCICRSKYGCLCLSPEVSYLRTKIEGGSKIFISNFASLSWRIALNINRTIPKTSVRITVIEIPW